MKHRQNSSSAIKDRCNRRGIVRKCGKCASWVGTRWGKEQYGPLPAITQDDHSINQSTNPAINRSIGRSIDQSIVGLQTDSVQKRRLKDTTVQSVYPASTP